MAGVVHQCKLIAHEPVSLYLLVSYDAPGPLPFERLTSISYLQTNSKDAGHQWDHS